MNARNYGLDIQLLKLLDNGIETREEIPSDENPDRSESGSISLVANNAAMEDNTGETTSDESGKDAVKKKLLMQEVT